MDYGAHFTKPEEEAIQIEARKEVVEELEQELKQEEELKRLTAEVEEAVHAQEEAEAEVAALDDAELAESDVGAEPVTEGEPVDDEGYFSDEENDAKAVATAEGGADPIESLDGVRITDGLFTPGSFDEENTGSYPPTPLDSPLGSIEENPEDEGFFEGGDESIPETKITPEGSTDEIQTDFELDGGLDEPLPSDDDGLSAERSVEEDLNMKRKIVKRTLKALAKKQEKEMKEAAGTSVSAENEDGPPNDLDAVSISDATPPTSSVPTPPASTTSIENADGDAVSTSDPTPPVSPVPTPEPSTVSTEDPGPFRRQETDRRVLKNSAAKRVIAALFPGDPLTASENAARDADDIIRAAAWAVEKGDFPIEDARKAAKLADAFEGNVDERFMIALGIACADVARADMAASLESKP